MRILIALLLMTGVAFAKDGPAGIYDLRLSDDVGWHNNVLTIAPSGDEEIRGAVSIDWGLGPQARAPQPDERVHVVHFTAKRDRNGAYRFSVQIGKKTPTRYDFELYVIERQTIWLAGTVTVQRVLKKGDPQVAGPLRKGFVGFLQID